MKNFRKKIFFPISLFNIPATPYNKMTTSKIDIFQSEATQNVGDKNESNINVNKYITNKKAIMINFTIYATVYTKELKDIINNASY